MTEKYISGKEASKILGVHTRTLYLWDAKGLIDTIRTPGNKRMYNVEKYLKENGGKKNNKEPVDIDEIDEDENKLNISYVRVSSIGQKDDLERQKALISELYPDHIMIEDIGSGVNLNKRGIRKIIRLAIAGKINEVVVAYKDRLARFGYELIEDLIKEYSDGKIIVIDKKDEREPEEELAFDVLQIMNVFVAKMNGLRKYKKKNKEEKADKNKTSKSIKKIKKI
jgi:predicted site-specific integrase-resolvase